VARFLALDWDHNQLHVVLATVAGGSVRVLRAAVWAEEAPLSAANAAAAGERLKARLAEANTPAAPVLACLGRDRVIVKDIRYPAVPPHEEPAVVRFQALKELTGSADEVVLDYTSAGDGPNGERRAMVLVARREHLNAYQELCQAAGLKLVGATPRPFGLAASIDRLVGTTVLMPPPEPGDGAVGVLAVAEGWAEFCVSRGGTLLQARSLVPGPSLAAEVRRSLAAYDGQATGQPVRAVYVAGAADNAALRERLHNLIEIPVHLLDPFAGSEEPDQPPLDKRGGFVGLVGLLYLRGTRTGLPVNFVHPKEPKPPADPNKRKLLIGLAVAAAVLVAVGLLTLFELSRLDKQLKAQVAQNRDLDELLRVSEEDDKRIKAIGAWNDQNVVWLDEFYDLTDRFPDPDTNAMRLSQVTFDVVDQSANAKEKVKHAGKMSLKGVVGDNLQLVDLLVSRYVADGYRTDPKHASQNRGPDRRLYLQEFTISRIDVDKRDPKQYTRRMDDEVEAARVPGRRAGR